MERTQAQAPSRKRTIQHTENATSKRIAPFNKYVEERTTIEKIRHSEILYVVSCHDDKFDDESNPSHPCSVWLDSPVPTRKSDTNSYHLQGRIPAYEIQHYMDSEKDDIAFVIVRTVYCSEEYVARLQDGAAVKWTESVYAKSLAIKTALKTVAMCEYQPTVDYPDVGSYKRNRIVSTKRFFFHHRDRLSEFARAHPDKAAHVNALLDYIQFRYGSSFEEADSLFRRGLVSEQSRHLMFRPYELIVASTRGTVSAFIATDGVDNGWLSVKCWSFRHDGTAFVRETSWHNLSNLQSNPTPIKDLSVYPLRYAPEHVQQMLQRRGEVMWSLRRPTYIGYQGLCAKGDQLFPKARFMVDYSTYRKMHEHSLAFAFESTHDRDMYDVLPVRLNIDDTPTEACLMAMPVDFYGFDFNEKRWIQLLVDNVCRIEWNKAAYSRLVLPEATKEMVQALVAVRKTQRGVKSGLGLSGKRTDITSGKGNGLIMLLHGAPGTGKTLTAESVAEIAEMPLYRVTCGDIGTSAEDVEAYLSTVLHLGKIWNCILLLDEADVFLEERESSDLTRNSLVSVFLRVLEYYDGILLLTSNRVGVLDEAFKSRIQVALHYEKLDRSARRKIWHNFIEMLEEDKEDVDFDELKFHVSELADKEMNGRQIRNILTTARQLAIYKDERLEWRHLKQALDVSDNFDKYLRRVQGHTDDDKAKDFRLRG